MNEDKLAMIGTVTLSIDEWRVLTQSDLNSRYSNPRFADTQAMDYALRPNSPIFNRPGWEAHEPDASLEAVVEKLNHDN